MINELSVYDNFFEDPDKIRSYALSLKYKEPESNDMWRGYRSFEEDESIKKIIRTAFVKSNSELEKLIFKYYFHYSLEKTKSTCIPSFYEYCIHKDSPAFAGVVYLSPNPKKDSGTSFFDDDLNIINSVQNVYNRFIIYPGQIYHSPTDFFGEDIYNSRLTISLFFKYRQVSG